jgi:hypothetical protein
LFTSWTKPQPALSTKRFAKTGRTTRGSSECTAPFGDMTCFRSERDQIQPVQLGRKLAATEEYTIGRCVLELLCIAPRLSMRRVKKACVSSSAIPWPVVDAAVEGDVDTEGQGPIASSGGEGVQPAAGGIAAGSIQSAAHM